MATSTFLIICVLFFSGTSLAEEKPLEAVWNHTSRHVHHAKEHTEHMLTINLTQEVQQKISDIAKTACDHFSTDLETQGNELQTKAQGDHKTELTTAANNAATQFKTLSQNLKGLSGSDLHQKNTEYFKAADKVLEETKKLIDAGPCEEIGPIIRSTLNELVNDSDNYQNQFHSAVGPHVPSDGARGHHHHHHHGTAGEGHHHHSDESASSEESKH